MRELNAQEIGQVSGAGWPAALLQLGTAGARHLAARSPAELYKSRVGLISAGYGASESLDNMSSGGESTPSVTTSHQSQITLPDGTVSR